MCNLYSITKGPQAIRDIARAMRGDVGNMPSLPGVFPDYSAPIVRNTADGRELAMARWGILRTQDEIDYWMVAPTAEALKLQRPLSDGALRIVARGDKKDGEP